MSNEFVPNDPETFRSRGFLTGRPITLGGVRAGTRPVGESGRVGMQFFFTETAKDGARRILSGFLHDGAWGDQMEPSENKRGLVPVSGAERPTVEKESPLGLLITSLKQAGCPAKLLTGDYSKLIGMVVQLEEKALPSFKRKKSVDPDEKAAPAKEYKTEVVSKLLTLPADNEGYEKLTEKEITKHLKEVEDKRSARKAASAEEPAEDNSDPDDEVEKPKAAKTAKKVAPKDDDDDDEDAPAAADSFGDADDDDAGDDDAASDDDDDEDKKEDPAVALASKLILKVLKAEKKVKGAALVQKIHPLLTGGDKKVNAAVLKLVSSPKFIAGVEGVSVKNNMVVLG